MNVDVPRFAHTPPPGDPGPQPGTPAPGIPPTMPPLEVPPLVPPPEIQEPVRPGERPPIGDPAKPAP